jgi:hypothetical protein
MSAFLAAPFAELAPFLVDFGYRPVPICPGAKAPLIEGWQQDHSPSHYLPRCADWGTGILTRTCPAVDLDIRDKEIVRVLIELATDMLGPSPFRIGHPPKTLLPFSTVEPFDKIISRLWALPGENWRVDAYIPHRIEILGDGQQFCVYHRHPRGSWYRWRRGKPMDTHLIDLPEIDHDMAIAFRDVAEHVLAEYGAVPLRRHDRRWYPDLGQPRDRERRPVAPVETSWQALDPDTLAHLLDAKHAQRLRAGAWITSCPAHESQGHRSLSITPRDGGGSVVHCFAGCEFIEVAQAIAEIVGRRAA